MVLVTFVVISCFAVYATYIDRTVYTTETLVIIPGSVTSDSWLGLESVLTQDISEYSLYQDFSKDNSAFVSEIGLFSASSSENAPTPENPNQAGTSSTDTIDETFDTTEGNDAFDNDGDSNEPASEGIPVESEATIPEESTQQTEPVAEESPAESEPESTSDSGSTPAADTGEVTSFKTQLPAVWWGGFIRDQQSYPLAQAVVDEPQSEAAPEPNESTTESVPEPTESALSELQAVTPEVSEDSVPVVTETELQAASDSVEIVADGETATTATGDETLEPDTNDTPGDTIDLQDVPADDVCVEAFGCKTYSMVFTGFDLPDFENGTMLDAAQLRLSLAAQTKLDRSNGMQRFVVEYTYDVGTSSKNWATAQVIDIEDEISNSINGGYFLISLDTPPTPAQLSNLSVRVSYQGNVSELKTAYVEGIWLEVTSGTFYESDEGEKFTDEITYNRELVAPEMNTLQNPELDPTLSSLPSFTLSYDPQQGFFGRLFRTLFSENTFAVENITLTDAEGTVVPVPFEVIYNDNVTWTMRAQNMPQKMKPGKYLVSATMVENGEVYTDSFEFYWGLLAVNTKKSMYFPNEEVELNLAALADKGDTICDAILELQITNPKNEFFDVPVTQSGSCGGNNVTDIPDYLATFKDTGEWGEYKISLVHRNKSGVIVHKIEDTFEVRDYIPFDITRTAPTRIYPPAPYKVSLDITAYRDFTGDINERVPRGFIIEDLENAVVSTLPDYTLITWKAVTLKEGERISLSYTFDAPDISPYMYLLGPLDMDGFAELRQWQIASDALNNIGWFEGTRTVNGTNLNTNVVYPFEWSTSSIDNYYFEHSTSSESQKVTLRQDGDYFVSVTLPQQRADANNTRTRIGVEVRKNGVIVPEGTGRSGFIVGNNGHQESSSYVNFLLTEVVSGDYIEVYTRDLTNFNAADNVVVTEQAAMYVEYISAAKSVFAAVATSTVASSSLNTATSALVWSETRQDTGFVHSNSVNPENIIISNPGTYLVHVNVPYQTPTTNSNVLGRVMLDGTQVTGGVFSQGYVNGIGSENDFFASIHWSGYVTATTSNQVLTITTEQEAATGTATTSTGLAASIYIEEAPTDDTIMLSGTTLSGGVPNDWSPAAQQSILWTNQTLYDAVTFTHSTTSSSSDITINEGGDYLLVYNDALTVVSNATNPRITIEINGVAVPGAQTKSHLIQNTANSHTNSSAALVYLIEDVSAGAVLRVRVQEEATNRTVDDAAPALLTLTKKIAFNERPVAPATFNVPFDNIRFASTTPFFEFQSNDPDGTSDLDYEFALATTSDFESAFVRASDLDDGFLNISSTSDMFPFTEAETIRFQIQPTDELTDLITYYWRVRAKDVTGSGGYGDWSTTQSFTVNLAATVPNWYQNYTGQFNGNTLVGTVSSGDDKVQVDSSVNTEILIAYGDGTNSTPRYRLWDGTAWGVQQNALAVGGTINWVKTAAGVNRAEYAMVTMDQSSSTYAQIYSASTTAWSDQVLLSGHVSSLAARGIAVGYESLSGDVMAVSCVSGATPVYRIWNGYTWSATSSITVSSINDCHYLEIASDPASDELILVVRDSGVTVGNNYEALVWDGSAWIANRVLGSVQAGQLARYGVGVQYEASGDQAIIVVTDTSQPRFAYTIWDGTSFGANTTHALGNDFEFGRLVADTDSDDMALCYIDDDADIGVVTWNGGAWQTREEIEVAGNSQVARPIDCEFETTAGRGDNLMIAYSDTVNVRYQEYAGSWPLTEQTVTGIQDSVWVQTERAGDGTIVMVAHDDAIVGDEIESTYFNGTSWSTKQSIIPNPSSVLAIPFETFDMTAKRFAFYQGVITTQPIDFSYVPNRPTWGDLSFSTTEPFGTDVEVRLRYSSTTVCDTYIPDIALPGNDAGIDVASSTVDISGLSTTTYSQICLEATISTLGSASASLDDWSLTWQREPKLVQNDFRFYVNGSFFTPTDPWPFGVTDVLENTVLGGAEAVNINDTIRLRMSLRGANVDLATSTDSFKIQYAEGQSCSPLMAWADVGDIGSTTAVWRGYENVNAGGSWYDTNWLRRIKITIDAALVEDELTDFPVYLNLDDLPVGFFDTVQTDGDDIRITTADAVTEVPFELVSINTSTDKGELHFKADVSSTTDSEFYIYYGNSAAAPYAASATYGAQNVWTNSYSMRHPLDDSPVSASPQFKDSTSNSNDAVARAGMTAGDVVAGKLGNAIDLDGNDGGVFESQLIYPGTFTASMWWNSAGDGFAIDKETGAADEKFGPWSAPAGKLFLRSITGGTSDVALNNPPDGSWAYLVVTRDSANKVDVHINGSSTRMHANAAQTGNSSWGNFGGQTSQGFRGLLDELRFSNVRRTNGWIKTEFNNQSNATGFYSVSSEEIVGDGTLLPSTLLSESTYAETYEEKNPTNVNRNAITIDSSAEWDFVLQNNVGAPDTNYCFRMVYSDGSTLSSYENYPRVVTNSPPPPPTLVAPFDNEQTGSSSPVFEFFTDDALSDEVSYEIQIDDNYDFNSVTIARESNANFSQFTNLASPSERGLYTTGNTIQFIPNATLTNGTYYWRVRAKDDNGSGSFGGWSTPQSFTLASTSITTWFQTRGEQFETNNLLEVQTSTSSHDVAIQTGFTTGTTTSTVIDYDDKETGNAWGEFSFTQNVTSGSIKYFIEYHTGGDVWALVPEAFLPGNAVGLTSSPISLAALDTDIHNEIRVSAVLSGSPSLPRLLSWTVTWGQTIEVPTIEQPFDNAKANTLTPDLTFFTTDPQSDDLEYEVQISSSYDFAASSTFNSSTSVGFVNTTSGGDLTPFTSGNTVRYTVQSPLSNGLTYWWRVRARDPGDTNTWSQYNTPVSFTVDTGITISEWYQTTGDQFATDAGINIETPSGGAQITSIISGVMSVYGEGVVQVPQYRIWNGTDWSDPESAQSVDAQIRWTQLKASPTRPEYALGTLGTDLDTNFQIYNGVTESWGEVFETYTEATEDTKRRFDLEYETISGDLLTVTCTGNNAVYSIWNGSAWSATSSITLTNANDCEWVQLAADPTSNEIIATFRHTSTGSVDFEALVWDGTGWGDSTTFGDISNNSYEGMTVRYEESGDQALAVFANNTNNSFLWSAWNGTSWSTATATPTGNDFYWASLKRDVGTDNLVLCYVDGDNDIGIRLWNGSAWNSLYEIDQNNNDIRGRAVDCEFETLPDRDGDILISYSDGVVTRYQTYSYASSTYTLEANLSTMNDGWTVDSVRADDGIIHTYIFDDATNPDRYDTARWDGTTWSTVNNFSINPSITVLPYNGSISMAAQIVPNFTEGSIRSTSIDFDSGNSPRWERVRWNDTTPGASEILYRIYYEASPDVFELVPDSSLPGNAVGFTNSPISIADLDRTIYLTLQLDAELVCSSGNCPSIQDWSLEWSEGITVSGSVLEYDQLTAVATGTIAVAVNGVLQVEKTATLGSGTTTTQIVFDTAGTSTFTVPTGVTEVTVKAWGAGGGAGGGGTSDAGGAGGGGGFIQGTIPVIPAENLTVKVGDGGYGGALGLAPGAGGGGGLTAVSRTVTPLVVAGAGGGGGGGVGGIRYVGVGTACTVNGAACTPTVPTNTQSDDVYIAVLQSYATTAAHTCTANCTGWTEFSSQPGTGAEGRLSVWWYRQSGAAPANPTFAGVTDGYTGRIWAFRGVANTGNPYDVIGANTSVTPATSTFTGSSLNSTVADAMVVHVTGSRDDNSWGPSGGACTVPNSVNTSFYTSNTAGNDTSISLCYQEYPLSAAGSLGEPVNRQVAQAPDVGRYFTFALRPNSSGILASAAGGVGGGLVGGDGDTASTSNGGGGGTQSAGGSAGGGTATNGDTYTGGAGTNGVGGGAGGAGGVEGGGSGGTGNFSTLGAGGGGGGAGYYGGGGGNNATGVYIPGAGGGGSSFIIASATASTTNSGSGTQPGNIVDVDYFAGAGVGNTSATSSNGGNGGDGRVVISWSVANVPGAWTIQNVPAFPGDVITVFVTGATGTAEAVGVTKYDGAGDITGMQLAKRHLTLGSDDVPTISNGDIGLYENGDSEDIFFSVNGSQQLTLCAEIATCSDARLRILASTTYQPGANATIVNLQNNGSLALGTTTLRVGGLWQQLNEFIPDTSTVIFTATTSSSTPESATSSLLFNNVTFGETAGSAIWNLTKPLDITGTLGIDFGTLARGTTTINVEQGLRVLTNGQMTGLGTTTFDGSGSHIWTDTSASSTNIGHVVIDGTAKTITLGSAVTAQSITIGADDTLNASGSGFNLNVLGNWSNNNAFIPQSGTVTFIGTTTGTIARGTSAFNNLTFNGVGGVWSFATSTLSVNGNFTIATGTVTLPTGTTTVGASFLNTGGTFAHNNGEVRMTSTAGGRSITQRAGAFLNTFYDLVFTGSGAWAYTEASATTTRNMNILSGTVTLASSTLTIGGDFKVTGSGAFAHNNGEVVLLVQESDDVRANGSSFNNVRTRGAVSGSWYNDSWIGRVPVVIQASQVDGDLTNFPVYVNLDDLPAAFFSGVKSDGSDIRVTQGDGITEVPHELVSINAGSTVGELYFRATTVSSSTNTTYYIYYGNTAASAYASTTTYGARNVWSNGYVLVSHMGDLTNATVLNSTSTLNGVKTSANNPLLSASGKIYSAQDFSGDAVQYTGTMLENQNQYNVSMWFNPDALTGGNADEQNFGRSLYGISAAGSPYQWLRAGGTTNPTELTLCAYDAGTVCNVTSGAGLTTTNWHYVSVNAIKSATTTVRVNGTNRLTFNNTGSGNVSQNFTIGDLRSARLINFDGRIDEVRVAAFARSDAWRDAEFRNTGTSTNFYAVNSAEALRSRVFTDTNATILGNLVTESGGDIVFPTGVLSIGGSLNNDALFNANSGTVRFNSTSGAETIAVGSSTFATVDFNATGGDFTVTENATATVAFNLTNAAQFTLSSGRVFETTGTFTNAASGTNTTWTGSTLRLSGSDSALNNKTHGGDTYGTLETLGDTDVTIWNSNANSFVNASTSSIYSADHDGNDGDLNIYGNYVRTTGTEYWSFATDFDGTALLASTSRQVDVRIATSARIGFVSASLNLVGGTGATTTIDAVSGAYSLSATNTTITAQNFSVAGADAFGLTLRASTTLSSFQDGLFTVVPGRSGMTISSSTVAHNPSAQFQRISFATTSAGVGTNVTLVGTTGSFVWFRNGLGNLYGEAYDAGDANPGSIRFDDSSNSITVSGTVYANDGTTTLGSPTCNGTTPNVRIVVNNGTYTASTSCAAGSGAYSFAGVTYTGDPKITVYLNTNGGVQGTTITKTPTANITNMHIYANRIITRHQDVLPLTIADMTTFDFDDDSDVRFVATTTGSTTLTVLPNTSLFVFATTTFAPGGNVTLTGNASTSAVEGTLQLGNAATFTATGTETHTLSGRLVLATTSVFTGASSTFVFNATSTGKSITSPNTVTFNQLQFTGVGGGWNITAPIIVQGNMDVATGTVTGTSNITITNGSLSGNGTLSLGSGTTTINQTNTLGGTRAWTFANLVLGNGSIVGTTTPNTTATTTVSGRLTIGNAHVLQAGATLWDLSGTGTVFVETGTLLEDTSTFRYSGTSANVLSTGYYNLDLNSGAGSATYTGTGVGIGVLNNLTIGGSALSNFTLSANDPQLIVGNDVLIRSNGTMTASDIATTTVARNWTNSGNFVSNNGTVTFIGSASSTILAGSSTFGNLTINGSGDFTMASSATTTGTMQLVNHNNFTLSPGNTLALGGSFTNGLGGGATTWTGSALHFYGSNTKSINASTTSDVYQTLSVAAGTNVRMWNSTSTSYNATGGIYSQDHDGTDGLLHIYGAFTSSGFSDYWSYDTDFDGTSLAGGTERPVTVRFASSSSAVYTGGSLTVLGSTTASTSLEHQGVGTYGLTIAGTTTTNWNRAIIRNINNSGVVLTSTPTVTNFSNIDHLVTANGASALTVGGTVINANEAKSFTGSVFATSSGVTSAFNVTATGTAISSWRFTNYSGTIGGESFDSDPAGDPGYVTWEDSASLITVSGTVYSDEGTATSTVCDGITNNIRLVVANPTSDDTYNTTCSATTGAYSITNVDYSDNDALVVYIVGETEKATTVTTNPISSISNLHIYENRVIVRHESTNPLSIARMAEWSSVDDPEVQYTAVNAGVDTLTIPANRKLLIWTGKIFEPNGNVTVSGGGGGGAQDGTLEAQTNATFRAQGTEEHSVGGSFIFGTGATFTAAQSTTTFTTTGSGRTIDVNAATFGNVAFNGSGSWTITDPTFATSRSFTQSNGTLTFGSGTTTIGRSFNATAGSFVMPGTALVFVSTTTGNIVRFDDSVVPGMQFVGTGGAWSMTDTNATTTGSFAVASGTVTLPSGNLAVSRNFTNTGGTITHNTADVLMLATSSATLTASGSSLFAVRFIGTGPFTIGDVNLTLADSLTLATGTLNLATGTLSVAGDFLIASGTVNNATGTVLFNATTVGKTIYFGASALYNVVFGSGTGGWNFIGNATTTNNFSITGASSFTKEPNTTLSIGGVFTNLVGGTNTTWATSTIYLAGTQPFTINTKAAGGDVYGTLFFGSNLAVRSWNSSAATTTVSTGASWYSQDHGVSDGVLNIYGDFRIATTTEYWSYSTDFDGAPLNGLSQRAVTVRHSQNATTTLISGALNILGTTTASTSITHQATGTYSFVVEGGTIQAQYYTFSNLDALGVQFVNTPTITNLSNGYYNLAVNTGILISLSTTSLDANASKVWSAVGFNATSGLSGINVSLSGSTSNAWRFSGSYGNLDGEAFDDDGLTACGSIRWDDSGCLLTQQSYVRWRNDDGGEGAPTSEWYSSEYDYRKRVRIVNSDASSYASTAVKITVAYDSNMQADFDDLRFTAVDGVTPVPYWVERYTASTDAIVWVRVPDIAANSIATVFMYYGSSTASTTSSGVATFSAFDDFEDNNISEYSGDTGLFQTDTAPVYGGTYALEAINKSGRTTDGIFRTALTVSQGQIIRWMQYLNTTTGLGDEACTLFGVQAPGTSNNNYAVCLEQFGIDRIAIAKNVSDNDVSGTVLASTTATFATGWYEVEVDWQTNNTIKAYLRTDAGALVASTTATDASYTTGGLGFSFWFQNGSWDSMTARSRAMIAPTVYFGAEQTDGGATWSNALNAAGNGVPGDTKRLRIAVENSGLDITAQTFQLEFASKGTAPSCEAVSSVGYAPVPNQASCGSSPVCMQTSTNLTDDDVTTDLLASTTGAFTAGRVVESPSALTSALDVNQNYYTELEYVLTPTINATSSYCFRVTNGGTPLDFYSKIAELGLQFDPAFGPVTLNNGTPIILTPGTTTAVYATGTVTDFNGYTDIVRGTSTIYRSGVEFGPSCIPDSNNCYVSNTASTTCTFTNCTGNTCTLSCRADIIFHAEATDELPYEGEEWMANLEVSDSGGGYDFAPASGVELQTLRYMTVDAAINYGSLAVTENTGSYNPTTTISNLGNVEFNVEVSGSDLTDGSSSIIPADEQKFATSTFTYGSCLMCSLVSTSTPVELSLGLVKPTAANPPVSAPIYWGIEVPLGVASVPHQGVNYFVPVSP